MFPDREIHLWFVRLTDTEGTLQTLHSLLSPDERQRAGGFHFEVHRQRFVLARGMLRAILGHHLGAAAKSIRFVYRPQGKPELAAGRLHFNLSHSEDLAVYAFSRDLPLGVDVERIRPLADAESIARRFFCPAECGALLSLPATQRTQAFFHCWTRKEAFIKALGGGLSVPLDRFQVSLLPDEPARVLLLDGDADRAAAWSLQSLDPAPGFAGALAVRSHDFSLRTWRCGSAAECLEELARQSAAPADFYR